MPDRIPAISLWRPWTTCITRYSKSVENRGWETKYRGPVYVHGAKRWTPSAVSFAASLGIGLSTDPADHPTGVIAVVDLVDVCDDLIGQCTCGPWAMEDQFHWQLSNVRVFAAPIDCRGRQGLWWPTGELAEQLARATAVAVVA